MLYSRSFRRLSAAVLSVALMAALSACGDPNANATPTPTPAPESTPSAPIQSQEATPSPATETDLPTPTPSESAAEAFAFTYDGLEDKIASVLEDIITDDMDTLDMCRAIYDYTRTKISYSGDSDKTDWEQGAYVGLTARRGDCFTYYAVARAMLSYLGIPNETVTRDGGITDHFWLLVDFGYGWYHFDSTPRSSKMPAFDSFMFTDAGAAAYTEATGEREYYKFDGSVLPERATVELEDLDTSEPAAAE